MGKNYTVHNHKIVCWHVINYLMWLLYSGNAIRSLLVWTGLVSLWLCRASLLSTSGHHSHHSLCAWHPLELGSEESAWLYIAMYFRAGKMQNIMANMVNCRANPEFCQVHLAFPHPPAPSNMWLLLISLCLLLCTFPGHYLTPFFCFSGLEFLFEVTFQDFKNICNELYFRQQFGNMEMKLMPK